MEAGQDATYDVTVTNSGPTAADGITLTDTLGSNSPGTITSLTPNGQGTCILSTATCDLGSLPADTSATVTVTVHTTGTGTLTNTATIQSADDNTPGNNAFTATTEVTPRAVDLMVTKTGSSPSVESGQNVTYTVIVTNKSTTNTAHNITLDDSFSGNGSIIGVLNPSQGTCTGLTCDLGDLGPDGSATVTLDVIAGSPGTITNTATAALTATDETDPNPDNNTATTTTPVTPPSADLFVTKQSSQNMVAVGEQASYTVTVTNRSTTNTAHNITLADALSANSPGTITSLVPSQGTCNTSTCSLGSLSPETSATITVTVDTTGTGTLTNTAAITHADESDPNTGNNTATATITVNNPLGCTIIGTNGNDTLAGDSRNNVICGLGGNDTINAGSGTDIIYSGTGDDTVNGGSGDDLINGGPGNDILAGDSGNDTINGQDGNDQINGGSNNDTINPGPGNDTANGDSGNDNLNTLDGVNANDTANGGPGTDTCTTDPGDTRTSC